MKRRILRRTIGLLVLLATLQCCTDRSSKFILLIKNVGVISMENGTVEEQDILIMNNIIAGMGNNLKHHAAEIIDATGKYVIPGLSDMHIHIDHPDILKLNLAYGVTSIMNYRGLPEHLIFRERSKENEIFAPNIYTTGDYMEGYPATFPGFLSFDDPLEAKLSVAAQKKEGYDFIKVYRNVDSTLHAAICDEASIQGMTVVGHLSPKISLEQSFKNGQKVVAHAEEVMYFFDNKNDTSRINEMVSLFKKYDVTFTPNLTIFKSIIDQVERIDSINSQDYIKYLHPALFQSWRRENNYNHYRGQKFANFMKDRYVFLKKVTKALHDADVPILASTDAPTASAFPGIVLHGELREFVQIGLTPLEALRTATIEPGMFIKECVPGAIRFGKIETGYRADLLILEENPLVDISNTESIHAVVKNGAYYSTEAIYEELNGLEVKNMQLSADVLYIEEKIRNDSIALASEYYKKSQEKEKKLLLGYYTTAYKGYRYLYDDRKLTQDSIDAEKAVTLYTMYKNDYPNMHGSHYLLGLAHLANRDTLSAIQSFNQALELHEYHPYTRKELTKLKNYEVYYY